MHYDIKQIEIISQSEAVKVLHQKHIKFKCKKIGGKNYLY